MIQRIQSVFLLLVAIATTILLFSPVGHLVEGNSIHDFFNLHIVHADGTRDYAPWALFAILCVVTLLAVVSIFLYKKRMLQIRLGIFSIILLVGYYIVLAVFIGMLKHDAEFTPSWAICLPFISIVFSWLAIRAIGKDEMLVRAYDRLR